MAAHALSRHFDTFFGRLNPGSAFEQTASSQHSGIRQLIEDRHGAAAELNPITFLQGSYRQETAIYSINDVDIVALCNLTYPGTPGSFTKTYDRDEIFRIIAAPLLADRRYQSKVNYGPQSTCIKVDLGIKIEILPVVFKTGNSDPQREPFVLYRPETSRWEDGFARFHQFRLSAKNADDRARGNFIPSIKVLKHLRSRFNLNAVSFHVECLLYALPDSVFFGGPADYLAAILLTIATRSAADWYQSQCITPCGDRDIFTAGEWTAVDWWAFHEMVSKASAVAQRAITASMRTPLTFALLTLLLPAVSLAETTPGQHRQEFEGTIARSVHIKYLVFIPDGYHDGEPKRWPLIMYLHGGSRRGDDIEKLREPGFGLTALVEKDKSFPFIVLSPQCPEGEYWTDTEALIGLLFLRRVFQSGHKSAHV